MLTRARLCELLTYDADTGEFYWRVGRHRGKRAGILSELGYIRIKIGPKRHMAHRLAWLFAHGEFPNQSIDHRDGVRNNNRIDNLRPATRAQQMMNSKLRTDNRAGLKGVRKRSDRDSFAAVIGIDGKQRTIGYFKTPELAHAAYANAAKNLFGDYGRLS